MGSCIACDDTYIVFIYIYFYIAALYQLGYYKR